MKESVIARGKSYRGRGKGPHPIDIYVGQRVRQGRTMLGLSQEKLADAIGLTFQQVQKYESGANRISASRLYEIGQILNIPVSSFFDGVGKIRKAAAPGNAGKKVSSKSYLDLMTRDETLKLVRAYYKISDPEVRKHINLLVREMGGEIKRK